MRASDLKVAMRRLKDINWDLNGAWTAQDLHDLHWYPATYPPQIPRLLVSLFSKPDSQVLDPFCGSGTTLFESIMARRYVTGIECNPVGAMIAEAKLLRRSPVQLISAVQEVRAEACAVTAPPSLFEPERIERAEAVSHQARASGWYHPKTFAELMSLWHLCNRDHGDIGGLLRCAFSSILKSASGQSRHWGYVADNMRPANAPYKPAAKLFIRRLDRLLRQLDSLAEQLSPWETYERYLLSSRVIAADIRSVGLPQRSIDLVVTSPPYVGVTDYVRSQRLSFDWFGWSLKEFEGCEIGARWKRFRKTASCDYLSEMASAAKCIADSLRPAAICIFVIGQSCVRDADQEITRSLLDAMSAVKLTLVADPIERKRSRQRLVNRAAIPSKEAIYVFQKGAC